MKAERRLMTLDEMQAVEQMACVTFPVASWDKRFYRWISSSELISEKEVAQLWRLFKRYRRQMSFLDKARLLALADKLAAPDLRKLEAARREQARINEEKAKYEKAMQNQPCPTTDKHKGYDHNRVNRRARSYRAGNHG